VLDFENVFAQPDQEPTEPTSEDPPPKRRRRSPKRLSPLHEARIDDYRQRLETRGWIFTPPSPELPISSLFDHLTTKQIVGLGAAERRPA
jgi:hypothetical protein